MPQYYNAAHPKHQKEEEAQAPGVPENESGLIQMIRMGQSIRHKWVNCNDSEGS